MITDRYERMNLQRQLPKEKIRVAAYCRVSTDHEDQTNSFESQQRYFRHFIDSHPNWELFEIFADEGLSGTSTKKRKSFNQMIACAKRGDFDLILTKEISRFARNTLDSIFFTRDLKKHGVGVIFLNDNINTLDGDSELRLAIMSSIAQEESRKTSERVKWGQHRQMEQGIVFGRTMLGYDIKDGKMQINETGANIVRLIFHKFVDERKSISAIARELLDEGVSPMYAQKWQPSVILRILRNEKYCGDLVQQKTYTPDYLTHEKKYNKGEAEFVIIPNHHQPIVSRVLFENANRLLEERSDIQSKPSRCSRRYPLSGKILCGMCGSHYIARTKRKKDGTYSLSWRCQEANKHGTAHTDSAGDCTGCNGHAVRNSDCFEILRACFSMLEFDRESCVDKIMETIVHALAVSAGSIALFPVLRDSICQLIDGISADEAFYAEILDQIIIGENGRIDIFWKYIPIPLHYQVTL